MPWTSAYSVVLVGALTAVGVLIGRIRGDSPPVIALSTGGLVIFFFGMAWSTSLGQEAFSAMAVATFGMILATMGSERSRVARSVR